MSVSNNLWSRELHPIDVALPRGVNYYLNYKPDLMVQSCPCSCHLPHVHCRGCFSSNLVHAFPSIRKPLQDFSNSHLGNYLLDTKALIMTLSTIRYISLVPYRVRMSIYVFIVVGVHGYNACIYVFQQK